MYSSFNNDEVKPIRYPYAVLMSSEGFRALTLVSKNFREARNSALSRPRARRHVMTCLHDIADISRHDRCSFTRPHLHATEHVHNLLADRVNDTTAEHGPGASPEAIGRSCPCSSLTRTATWARRPAARRPSAGGSGTGPALSAVVAPHIQSTLWQGAVSSACTSHSPYIQLAFMVADKLVNRVRPSLSVDSVRRCEVKCPV